MSNVVVVKCGGSMLEQLSDEFFASMKRLKELNYSPVLIHGGGPAINSLLKKLNVGSEFVNGLRKTSIEVLDVAEMILSGKLNKLLVTKLQQIGLTSIGISGCDGGLLKARPINYDELGFVGEIEAVNGELLQKLLAIQIIPVIAPIGSDEIGNHYNINADTVAGAIANKLQAKKIIFVTDVPGIMKDQELLPVITVAEIKMMLEEGTIYGGMIPKVKAAVNCLMGDIEEVFIINGLDTTVSPNGDLIGTKIVKTKQVHYVQNM